MSDAREPVASGRRSERDNTVSDARESRIVLDPTVERTPAQRAPLPRPASLAGKTVGLLDISKPRGDVFLDRLADLLAEQGVTVRRYAKPTFTKPAPIDLRREIITKCDLVIEALAD